MELNEVLRSAELNINTAGRKERQGKTEGVKICLRELSELLIENSEALEAAEEVTEETPATVPDEISDALEVAEEVPEEAVCRVCGCTDNHACPDGCYWVEPDLCSQCK